VLFYVFPDTENALVAIVPALANKGLLEVELENARREILKIMKEPAKAEDWMEDASDSGKKMVMR